MHLSFSTARAETWVVIAKRHGRYKDMLRSFPVCGSRQEAIERIRIKLGHDEGFRSKWRGWTFYPIRIDDGVVVGAA